MNDGLKDPNKNRFTYRDGHLLVEAKGGYFLMDRKDKHILRKYIFHVNNRKVVCGNGYLNRIIMDAKRGDRCVHLNGDPMDNRRSNLHKYTNYSESKGLYWDKKNSSWVTYYSDGGKQIKEYFPPKLFPEKTWEEKVESAKESALEWRQRCINKKILP